MINQIISHQKSNLFLNFANIKGCRSGTCGVLQRNLRRIHTLLMASYSGRNLIGWRTESDRAADGNQRRYAAHRCTNKANRESVPQNTRNTQNLLAEKCLPQIDTDAHRLGGYGIPAIPTPPITQPNHLWKSVNSVGEYYHAHKQADGERVPTEYAEHTEPSGRESLPQIGTDAHRLGGYDIPAIPTLPITQPNIPWIP